MPLEPQRRGMAQLKGPVRTAASLVVSLSWNATERLAISPWNHLIHRLHCTHPAGSELPSFGSWDDGGQPTVADERYASA